MKYLFENIVETEEIFLKITEVSETEEDRLYLHALVKDTLHHKLVDLVLDELNEEQKLVFMANIDDETQHSTTLQKLSEWIQDFEYKIITRAKTAERELVELIKNAAAEE